MLCHHSFDFTSLDGSAILPSPLRFHGTLLWLPLDPFRALYHQTTLPSPCHYAAQSTTTAKRVVRRCTEEEKSGAVGAKGGLNGPDTHGLSSLPLLPLARRGGKGREIMRRCKCAVIPCVGIARNYKQWKVHNKIVCETRISEIRQLLLLRETGRLAALEGERASLKLSMGIIYGRRGEEREREKRAGEKEEGKSKLRADRPNTNFGETGRTTHTSVYFSQATNCIQQK